jgi:hypothetical protein
VNGFAMTTVRRMPSSPFQPGLAIVAVNLETMEVEVGA